MLILTGSFPFLPAPVASANFTPKPFASVVFKNRVLVVITPSLGRPRLVYLRLTLRLYLRDAWALTTTSRVKAAVRGPLQHCQD